jgi:ABC-type transporter lipoprotein component MlaA
MIDNIIGSTNIMVIGGSSSGPYINLSNPSAGMVRYNGTFFEVYDGYGWQVVASNSAEIHLTGSALSSIEWVQKKMAEEHEMQKLAQDSPAVRAAYEAFKRASDQLKTTIILSKDQDIVK